MVPEVNLDNSIDKPRSPDVISHVLFVALLLKFKAILCNCTLVMSQQVPCAHKTDKWFNKFLLTLHKLSHIHMILITAGCSFCVCLNLSMGSLYEMAQEHLGQELEFRLNLPCFVCEEPNLTLRRWLAWIIMCQLSRYAPNLTSLVAVRNKRGSYIPNWSTVCKHWEAG